MAEACDKYETELAAFAAGTLSETDRARLNEHLAVCPGCRAEYEWLETLADDLTELGDAFSAGLPQVDLVDNVMGRLSEAEQRYRTVSSVSAKGPYRRNTHSFMCRAGMAAAAAAVIALLCWLGYHFYGNYSVGPRDRLHQARQDDVRTGAGDSGTVQFADRQTPSGPQEEQAEADISVEQKTADSMEEMIARLTVPLDDLIWGNQSATEPDAATLTFEDVVETRREIALAEGPGAEARRNAAQARLADWARLDTEQARELAEDPDTSMEALLGACRSLPPEEAGPLVESALEEAPEDPYIHFVLACIYEEQGEKTAQASAALSSTADLDSINALPRYMLADNLLETGDVDGALDTLDQARQLPGAYAYTQESAQCREQALVEAGMQPETARLVTALTAGNDEYNLIADLGQQLLDRGADFESEGDRETAAEMYEAVQQMGEQIEGTAQYSAEQLAGLDLERSAIDFLERVYTDLNNTSGLEWLADEVAELTVRVEEMYAFFNSLEEFFATAVEEQWHAVAEQIMGSGDLALFRESEQQAAVQ